MKKFALLITYVYAFCCPLEFILNVFFGSSVKFIAAAAVVVTAFFFFIEQKSIIRITAFQFCLIGWATLEAVSVLWTNVTSKTYSTLLSYLMIAAFVVLISVFSFDKKEADLFIRFYSLGALVLAIVLLTMGEVDGSLYTKRMTISVLGRNQDPNGLAAILLSSVFYSLHKVFDVKKFRVLYIAAFLLQSVALFYTGSRGGLVAYIVALAVFAAMKIPKKRRTPVVLGMLAFAVAGYFALQMLLPTRLFNRLFDFSAYLESGGVGRIEIWTTALKELVKSPIIGLGTTNHFYYFSQTLGAEFAMHNTFLCIAFEVGLVGLALFIIPFITTFVNAVKRKDALIVAILIANIAAAFFLDSLYLRFLWNALMFGVVYKNVSEAKTDEKRVI